MIKCKCREERDCIASAPSTRQLFQNVTYHHPNHIPTPCNLMFCWIINMPTFTSLVLVLKQIIYTVLLLFPLELHGFHVSSEADLVCRLLLEKKSSRCSCAWTA